MYKFNYHNKSYAGKIIHENLIPGYPETFVEQLTQFFHKIQHKSIKFAYYNHPNIEIFEAALQLSPHSPPLILSELLIENLDNYVMRMKGKFTVHEQLELFIYFYLLRLYSTSAEGL